MSFTIIHNDITKMETEAIVNAANPALKMGGGVCGAIFMAAGHRKLQAACDAIGHCDTGDAVITDGFNLRARYIIHTVGPVWHGGHGGESAQLRSAYRKSLELADTYHIQSIAFPLISAGIYGFPKDQALEIASSAIREFLEDHEMDVALVVFDRENIVLKKGLYQNIGRYLDAYTRDTLAQADLEAAAVAEANEEPQLMKAPLEMNLPAGDLNEAVSHLSDSFTQLLFKDIDASGMTDVQVYKAANMDRKLFSKIRSQEGYTPKKPTVIALAVALKLDLPQTEALLASAGYAFNLSSRFDVICRFFIEKGGSDTYTINEALFCFGQPLL